MNTAKGDVEFRGQYPSGKEREAINAAFDALVATMQSKETEKMMLYEQGEYGSGSSGNLFEVRYRWEDGGRLIVRPATPDRAEQLLGSDRMGGHVSHVALSRRALSWNDEIEQHGIAHIIGAPVGDATDMAELSRF